MRTRLFLFVILDSYEWGILDAGVGGMMANDNEIGGEQNQKRSSKYQELQYRMLAEMEGVSVEELRAQAEQQDSPTQQNQSTHQASHQGQASQQFQEGKRFEESMEPQGNWQALPSNSPLPVYSSPSPAEQNIWEMGASFVPQATAPHHAVATSNKVTASKPQDYRERRVDRASNLIKARYLRITNEANSSLLVDKFTGNVLPEKPEAIVDSIATDYRSCHGTEVSPADIKRAFGHFLGCETPSSVSVLFGRAGYDYNTKERYIDAGKECLIFTPNVSFCQSLVGKPIIRPTQSLPLDFLNNGVNIHSGLVNALFEKTALPKDADLLSISWMILSWMPDRLQVMLELLGRPSPLLEFTQALIKNIVDPATVSLKNELPINVKQLEELAHRQYLLSFNQVTALTAAQQKHFYNLMRGKQVNWQWAGKKLNSQITIQCPVMLNSLESVVTDSKLADATLSIEVNEEDLRHFSPEHKRLMQQGILAGLLMIFGYVNEQWEGVAYDSRFDRYGGLADLCRVGELVAGCLRQDKGAFWQQFNANQQGRREYELEESPIASALVKALDAESSGVIDIPVMEWLAHLKEYRPEGLSSELWPTSSRGLGAKFKLIKPLLRDVGITLTSIGQRGPRCYWRAEKAEPPQSHG